MADITESAASPAQHEALPSLAAFRVLSTQRAAGEQADTAAMARVAAELLTDARRLRGRHGDKIVVAPSGSAEHELHVNLHAGERAALAAQRRGVEALTARLRDDTELLLAITDAAMADLEASARSLLGASSLSDQLLVADASSDGGPPPPPALTGSELVVDLTTGAADVQFRPSGVSDDVSSADELDAAALALASANWEARREAILQRVERARRPEPDDDDVVQVIEPVRPLRSDDVSPIIAAALAAPTLQPSRPESSESASDSPMGPHGLSVVPSEELEEGGQSGAGVEIDEHAEPTVDPGQVETEAEDDDEVIPIESRLGDLSTADAIVIDIADAPSVVRDGRAESELADVIELQTEATLPEWPVWKGPDRSVASDVVSIPSPDVVSEDSDAGSVDPSAEYPRLVSVAPDEPEVVSEPTDTITEDMKGPVFSFAPAPPSDEMLPVPITETGPRKTQEEIAAEARALIADQKEGGPSDSFSPREVRRRQRRLRSHQRAVEKAESRNQRDRRRVELEHERSLAAEPPDGTSAYAPTWFAQLAFAIAICVLVVMVAMGLWFLLAEDPGLF